MRLNKKRNKSRLVIILLATCIAIVGLGIFLLDYYNLLPRRVYSADDFSITTLHSEIDFNSNGLDDYADIMLGARTDAQNHPTYDGRYWDTGYPPDDIGVCTDVVWRAFKNAGYSLRDMVNHDIEARSAAYPAITTADRNIDFRRVENLRVFFDKFAVSLTPDINEIELWQPGDIVLFGKDEHIGIVSDKRNKNGQPYIIHNGGQRNTEEDILRAAEVTGHYRFDASQIDAHALVAWHE